MEFHLRGKFQKSFKVGCTDLRPKYCGIGRSDLISIAEGSTATENSSGATAGTTGEVGRP